MRNFLKAYWLSIIIATLIILCAFFGCSAGGIKSYFGSYTIVFGFIFFFEIGLLVIHAAIFCLLTLPLYWYFKPHISLIGAIIYSIFICELSLLGLDIFVLKDLVSLLELHLIFCLMGLITGLLFNFLYKYFQKRQKLTP